MPSLREQMLQQKAERTAAQEADAAANKERELGELKQKFDALVSRRTAIAQIKEAAAAAQTGMKEARAALRNERGNLRAIHEESRDEATGEALVPKPVELIGNEEYKEADEVVSYNQARDAFRMSAEKIREVEAQLTELGIENPSELLPGQLEALLEEKDNELNEEARAFVIEHPDVNPEMAARVREELVASRTAALVASYENTYYQGNRLLGKNLGTALERNADIDEATRETMRTLAQNPEMRKELIKTFQKEFTDVNALSDLDTDAVVRLLAREALLGRNYYDDYENRAKILERLVKKEFEGRGEAIPRDFLYENNPRELKSEKTGEYFLDRVLKNPATRSAAEGLLEELRIVSEYEAIPQKLRANEARLKEIKERLDGDEWSQGESISQAEKRIERRIEDLRRNHERAQERATEIKEFPKVKASLLGKYPESLLDEPIRVNTDEYGRFPISLTEYGSKELGALDAQNENDEKLIKESSSKITAIRNESDGLLGSRKRDKAARIQQIEAERANAEQRLSDGKRERLTKFNEISDTREAISEELKAYRPLAKLGGFQGGTLRELLAAMEAGLLKAAVEAEKSKSDFRDEEEKFTQELRELDTEKTVLIQEKQKLDGESYTLQEIFRRHEQTLRGSGYLPK